MLSLISTIIKWLLGLLSGRQSAQQVQAQNVGTSTAEQGLEESQNETIQQDKQAADDAARLRADGAAGSLRDEAADVNRVIARPGAGR